MLRQKSMCLKQNKNVFVFFNLQDAIYINHVPKRARVNSVYTRTALSRNMKVLKKKKPDMAAGDRYFHKDNAPVQPPQLCGTA
jgi:hypothetical protein